MHTTKSNDELILETSVVFNTLMNEQGYSTDPRKQREVLACLATGCRPNPEKTGPDCYYFENGKWLPAERKSTTFKYCRGAYTGISNKATWEEQIILLEKKIRDMGRHYYDRFDKKSGALVESWWISGEKVYELLLPRVKSDFDNKKALIAAGKTPADPRLSADITWTDIQEHGTQVI